MKTIFSKVKDVQGLILPCAKDELDETFRTYLVAADVMMTTLATATGDGFAEVEAKSAAHAEKHTELITVCKKFIEVIDHHLITNKGKSGTTDSETYSIRKDPRGD